MLPLSRMRWVFLVCVCACLCKRTSERSRERKMLLNIYYKHWTIRQFDVDDFSFGRSYSGQVWNHKWNIRLVYFSVWFHEYKNNLPNPWLFKWSCFMLCACMRVRALVFSCCNILNYVRLLLGRLQNFMWAASWQHIYASGKEYEKGPSDWLWNGKECVELI